MPLRPGPPAPSSAPRRRNGRQQACEPCRKRKVACDHRLPVCSRCRRGRISSSCVYLIQDRAAVVAARSPLTPSSGLVEPHTSPRTASPEAFTALSERNIGYLGATSYSAVFREAQNSLPSTDGTPALVNEAEGVEGQRSRLMVDDRTFETALSILRSIPAKEASYLIFKKHVNPNDGWCRLAAERLIDGLWTSFETVLQGDRRPEPLAQMALLLCRNSSKYLKEDYHDPDEWLQSFSGPNLRWEALGVLFTYWSLGTIAFRPGITSDEGRALGGRDAQKLMLKYQNSASSCIEICKKASCANTLLLYTVYKQSILASMLYGDQSIQNCMLHGEAVSLASFLGLHVSVSPDLHDRSISAQIKRRLFAVMYNIDKVMATFVGRPPLISYRFASTPLPLDMSDEELLAHRPNDPDAARRRIVDENGWSTSGEIYSTTLLRARTMMAIIRESILDISLQATSFGGREVLLDLKKRQMDLITQFPPCIVYLEGDVANPAVHGPTLYSKILVRLEHLQNLFFIERLLTKEGRAADSQILDISMELVALTLIFWTHQDRLRGLHGDAEWLVMEFAAPAGGVLCLELLKGSSAPQATTVTRSGVIQQLSLLVGFLDWVSPGAPNSDICHSVKTVVRHVLDQTLNPTAGHDQVGAVEGMGFSADMNEFFSFDLLDTFDWLRPEGGI